MEDYSVRMYNKSFDNYIVWLIYYDLSVDIWEHYYNKLIIELSHHLINPTYHCLDIQWFSFLHLTLLLEFKLRGGSEFIWISWIWFSLRRFNDCCFRLISKTSEKIPFMRARPTINTQIRHSVIFFFHF